MRRAVTPYERLCFTLRFLETHRNFEDLNFSAAASPQALGVINPETCRAICEELEDEYCKALTTFINNKFSSTFKNVSVRVYPYKTSKKIDNLVLKIYVVGKNNIFFVSILQGNPSSVS